MKSEKPLTGRKSLENVTDRTALKSIIDEIAANSDKTEYGNANEYFTKRAAIARLATLDLRPSTPAIFIKDYITFLIK